MEQSEQYFAFHFTCEKKDSQHFVSCWPNNTLLFTCELANSNIKGSEALRKMKQ